MDREKVIKDLDELYRLIYQSNVDGEILGSLHDAIALLKEQEAVEPTWQRGKAYCGSCGKRIPLKIGARFCHKCGQKVKWE